MCSSMLSFFQVECLIYGLEFQIFLSLQTSPISKCWIDCACRWFLSKKYPKVSSFSNDNGLSIKTSNWHCHLQIMNVKKEPAFKEFLEFNSYKDIFILKRWKIKVFAMWSQISFWNFPRKRSHNMHLVFV